MPRARRAFAVSVVAHAAAVLALVWYVRAHDANEVALDLDRALEIDFQLADAHGFSRTEVEIIPSPPQVAPPLVARTNPNVAGEDPRSQSRAHVSSTTLTDPNIAPPERTARPTPNNGADPFLTWVPGQRPSAPGPRVPQSTGQNLLASSDSDAERAAIRGALPDGRNHTARTANGSARTESEVDARVREASAGYLRGRSEDAFPTQIAGSMPYYGRLRREMQRVWHPMPTPEPTTLDAIRNTFFSSQAVAMDATRRSLGPLADGRGYAAMESLNAAHPHSEIPALGNTMSARAAATARTTTVEVELDQDVDGHVIGMRVRRRSGISGFDTAAMDAVRAAIPNLEHPAMPGGWRSRWAFEVTVSRDPLISAIPGVSGMPAIVAATAEVEFDETTGQTEAHYPGARHRRTRVRLISSRPIGQ